MLTGGCSEEAYMRYAEKYKREGRGEEKNEGRKVSMRETRRKKNKRGEKILRSHV